MTRRKLPQTLTEAARLASTVDEEALARYLADRRAESSAGAELIREICGTPWPVAWSPDPLDSALAVEDRGEWSEAGGLQMESDREALIAAVKARQMRDAGNRHAEGLGTALADCEVRDGEA